MSIFGWLNHFRSTASGKPVLRTDDPSPPQESMDELIAKIRAAGLPPAPINDEKEQP